ncbi:MAG: hypothetical protein NMK33_01390 [Candidatus Cardinium sp.]|uniref:hypothetical protein n=1 Tax=Cardinium endosymbiont of Dermatophagoides farinae TaxID=2597823 RepID=UPI0011829E73|nr:hypothetical protein [Cardinium endosymbiont of Dermatophagoides farinae]TSJ81155.1 hypothetical protein FPG78_04060 [Cardinium endosymbiont of Dermatophagoides farinae]UWW97204.1 MAG: hypothetical protein NMK33_01390 [Candidatus Cardinium sp.]
MQKLVNSPYLKEKGFLGPFSLPEALVSLGICCLTYITSCYCEDWLHYNRMWTISLTSLMVIISFLVKIFLKNSNPAWLSSIFAYQFLHVPIDSFRIKFKINAFLKER